jgi:tetratricopeptide (TPR) repeat protein
LGLVAYAQGDYAKARSLQEDALAIFRERGAKVGIATALENLGDVARADGKSGEALANYAESIALYRELGSKGAIAGCLASIGAVWGGRGDRERAAKLSGAAESIRSAIGYQFLPADRIEHEQGLVTLRDALGVEVFDKAWAEGQALSFEEAVALALEDSG